MNKKNYYPSRVKGRTVFQLNRDSELRGQYNALKEKLSEFFNFLSRNDSINKIIRTLTNPVVDERGRHFLQKHDYTIIRCDIKDFFPSINKHKLYQKLTQLTSTVPFAVHNLSAPDLKLLRDLLFDSSFDGLPQGFAISSILSEFYLYEFDEYIKRIFPNATYIRYVDDFLIIIPNIVDSKNIQLNIQLELTKLNLLLSKEKFDIQFYSRSKDFRFDFLGYSFFSQNSSKIYDSKNKILSLTIAEKKIVKIKNKIDKYFLHYKKSKHTTSDFYQLYYQIQNIFKGIIIYSPKHSGSVQYIGIPNSYRYITEIDDIIPLIYVVFYNTRHSALKKEQKEKIKFLLMPYFLQNKKMKSNDPDYRLYENFLRNFQYNYTKSSFKSLKSQIKNVSPNYKFNSELTIRDFNKILFQKIYRQ
ncbi:RNA-directed DNA polymerase [Fructobacillus cardui]|uniref:Retron-type reverse transcriptase (YkfC) n=1 Tax=Fructobacillus cardui TaxID=2893170 RepID=A0ABM9MLK3_9LACO|nr:Retron-type reverse transcriptase (YkfC) [Fructobacillus cardui]